MLHYQIALHKKEALCTPLDIYLFIFNNKQKSVSLWLNYRRVHIVQLKPYQCAQPLEFQNNQNKVLWYFENHNSKICNHAKSVHQR